MNNARKTKNGFKAVKIIFLVAYLLIAVAFILYTVVGILAARNNEPASFFTVTPFSVKNDSVTNGLKSGDAVFVRQNSSTDRFSDPRISDIVVYKSDGEYRTAQIIQIVENPVSYLAQTETNSEFEIALSDIYGIPESRIPYLGYVLDFLDTKLAIVVIIIIPALILLIIALIKLKRGSSRKKISVDEFNPFFTTSYDEELKIEDDFDQGIGSSANYSENNPDTAPASNDAVFSELRERSDALSNYRKSMETGEPLAGRNSIFDADMGQDSAFTDSGKKTGQHYNLFDTQPIVYQKEKDDESNPPDFDETAEADPSQTLSRLSRNGIKTNVTNEGLELVMENFSSGSVILRLNHDGSGVNISTNAFEADIKISAKSDKQP
ncbi:MAG: hypothetical protein FWG69_02700 [Oscillospiraceae bacterium]|nr:hypothetical protein [Oscillospiraceae bacterium]